MIKAIVKSYSKHGEEEKLAYENTTIYHNVAAMEKDCKDRSSQYYRAVGEVVQEWTDDDPEGMQAYFAQLVARHDTTYNYSDDHNVWRKGQQERDVINHYAKVIGMDIATKRWNDHISKFFTNEDTRKQFSWKV